MFRIETSTWGIFPLMSMECPPSLLITFGWKSILLDIRTVTWVCLLGKPFSSPYFWDGVCLCCWGVFLACSIMMDPVYSLSGHFTGNWVHWCWEVLMTNGCSLLLFCCWKWYCVCVCVCVCVLFFWVFCEMINFLCFLGYSYPPCIGVLLLVSSVWLD
jgi:hypothetical protein